MRGGYVTLASMSGIIAATHAVAGFVNQPITYPERRWNCGEEQCDGQNSLRALFMDIK